MEETYYFNHLFQMNRKTTNDKLENMNKVINDLIEEVRSKNLSPIEQVMYVYDFVKSFEFSQNDVSIDRRQVDCVLMERKAVCAGFSDTFNEILRRMGFKTATLESYVGNTSHMNPIVEIKDSKYDINGIYNFDPTFDSSNQDSYAFFGRTMEEINKLKQKRVGRGCSLALMEGNTGNNMELSLNDIPLRTMNIINGFFPIEENFAYLKKIYNEGNDKSNWKKLNEPYMFQLFNLGFKFRRTESISMDVMESIISNISKIKSPSADELTAKIEKIKKETNKEFAKYFDDPRLMFEIKSENYVDEENYADYITKVNEVIKLKSDNDELLFTFQFLNGQDRKVIHRLIKINSETRQTLLESEFEYNYDFGRKLLLPLLDNYIGKCVLPNGVIARPEYTNFNIRDYSITSNNGLSLSIEAGDLEFIRTLDVKVKEKYFAQKELISNYESSNLDELNSLSSGKRR